MARSRSAPCWCDREDVTWTDIWNTVGLRGTASDQFELNDFFVRSDHSITREFDRECRESGPLYRMGNGTCYQVGFAGVACGIARGALDNFLDITRKVPRGASKALRDNAVVQSNLAQAEVNLRAARGYVLQSMADIWKELCGGAMISVAQRITMRLAATHAIHKAREAVDFAYNAAGATAIFENHPLERRFRDMHTVTQQLQGQLRHFETVGAWMMGVEVDLSFVLASETPGKITREKLMPLGGLQHYTIEPSDLEKTKDFYCDVLGLENGDRPPLDFPGYWLYSGGQATVHLMGTRKPREGIVVRGTEKKYEDTGRLDHIAFAATDVDGVRRRLQAKGVKFRESIVPRTGDTQFFMYDPDGVGVELNFPKT